MDAGGEYSQVNDVAASPDSAETAQLKPVVGMANPRADAQQRLADALAGADLSRQLDRGCQLLRHPRKCIGVMSTERKSSTPTNRLLTESRPLLLTRGPVSNRKMLANHGRNVA